MIKIHFIIIKKMNRAYSNREMEKTFKLSNRGKMLSKNEKNDLEILKIKRKRNKGNKKRESYNSDKISEQQFTGTVHSNNKIKRNGLKFIHTTLPDKSNIEVDNRNNYHIKKISYISNLTKDSYSEYSLNDAFSVFKSISDIFYLVYADYNKSIIFINLIHKQKINEIKNAHNCYITNIKHYFDTSKKLDLILSVSGYDNNIKLWDLNNLQCLIRLDNINKEGYLFSACLLNEKNENYIITSNCNFHRNAEPIKVYDMNSSKIKEINDSKINTMFIEQYYDNNLCIQYIITGNDSFVQSYNYDINKIYHKYYDSQCKDCHINIIINNRKKGIIELIESSFDGNIRIWDFHSGIFLKKIKVSQDWLFGLCLLEEEELLLIGCGDKAIKLIDLKNNSIIGNLFGHNNHIITIKKINLFNNERIILSQGIINDQIRIWNIKN